MSDAEVVRPVRPGRSRKVFGGNVFPPYGLCGRRRDTFVGRGYIPADRVRCRGCPFCPSGSVPEGDRRECIPALRFRRKVYGFFVGTPLRGVQDVLQIKDPPWDLTAGIFCFRGSGACGSGFRRPCGGAVRRSGYWAPCRRAAGRGWSSPSHQIFPSQGPPPA